MCIEDNSHMWLESRGLEWCGDKGHWKCHQELNKGEEGLPSRFRRLCGPTDTLL